MFALCQNMKWAHLPNAGGIYDQDPELMDAFFMIFGEMAKHEKEEADKRDRERKKDQTDKARMPSRMRRRAAR